MCSNFALDCDSFFVEKAFLLAWVVKYQKIEDLLRDCTVRDALLVVGLVIRIQNSHKLYDQSHLIVNKYSKRTSMISQIPRKKQLKQERCAD